MAIYRSIDPGHILINIVDASWLAKMSYSAAAFHEISVQLQDCTFACMSTSILTSRSQYTERCSSGSLQLAEVEGQELNRPWRGPTYACTAKCTPGPIDFCLSYVIFERSAT